MKKSQIQQKYHQLEAKKHVDQSELYLYKKNTKKTKEEKKKDTKK